MNNYSAYDSKADPNAGFGPGAPLVDRPPGSAPVIHAPVSHYAQSQYGQHQYPAPNSGIWTTGLCDCSEDCSSCCIGCWCPCVLVGKSVEAIDQGTTSCITGGSIFFLLHALLGCGCLYTCAYRARLRQKYGLPETPCADFCTDCCCLGCSICQVYREVENRNKQSIPSGAPPTAPGFQFMTK